MARDRMAEFLSFVPCRAYINSQTAPVTTSTTVIKANNVSSSSSSCFLPIDNETKPIFDALSGIQQMVEGLGVLHVAQLVESRAETRQCVYNAVEKVGASCHACREMIAVYDNTTQQMERDISIGSGCRLNTAELQVRRNIVAFMERQLMLHLHSAWVAQRVHEERLIEVTTRRVKVRFATAGAGGDNCDNSLASGIGDAHARGMAQKLLATGNEDQLFFLARDELERVMRTRDAVLELEREMQEILKLFGELHYLVYEQHECLFTVQEHVNRGNRNIEVAVENLKKAKHHQKACCFVM
ncbi:hypothetical protein DQ04_01291070 [Trypanosoma grayi]|uniref:hypothetical protein n=1 Tax=Trypanosoma grayi TaxID=71804 RepID=UPI0004F4366E|nr:hypothetical protein DQ04_01291070 [Trypanosoma grayi]KEG12977.1 hypothetical protein DQ04_01291070 [Trypanosoma grayi]